MNKELLRKLPKIDILIKSYEVEKLIKEFNREQTIESLRYSINGFRDKIINNEISELPSTGDIVKVAEKELNKRNKLSLRKVINCTGIVIHTNLGRSLLSDEAIKAMNLIASSYNNLEYDLKNGIRGSRHSHINKVLMELTEAEDAIVVNNNAGAVMLVLNEFAKNKEVIVSRGELVEIGGSFRIPEIMEMSGSCLKEVGTTNRTHKSDYENAINDNTALLLKVHSSNFKIIGFTKEVGSSELAHIGIEYGIPTMEDLGSGMLVNLSRYGLEEEKTVADVVKSGIDLITFSGDKLLGGPQAGIIVGKKKYIDRLKTNPLMRALRVDKLILAALEATLIQYLDKEKVINKVPTLNMISTSESELNKKAIKLLDLLDAIKGKFDFILDEDSSFVGGGTMPGKKIKSYVIKIHSENFKTTEIEEYLRKYKTPIITRINKDKVILDIRTIRESEYKIIFEALKEM